jgi:glutathione S-transferase
MTLTKPLVLYSNSMWTSPYVLSCFVGLTEKMLPFEVKTLALHHGAHRAPSYLELSLTARVPTLLHGDFALSESSAIVEYLEDSWPSPTHVALLPHELRARARARQIMAWLRSDLLPIREERSAEYVFYPHAELPLLEPLSAHGHAAVTRLLSFAERVVPEDSGHLFGAWCIADTDLAMMLQRLVKTHEPLPARIQEFAEREWQRPSVQAFVNVARPTYQPNDARAGASAKL